MLYERAKQLQRKGLSSAEIRAELLAAGHREEDVKVILGSLGLGPQPQADPTPRPLVIARRVLESRPLRFAVFALGAAVLGALPYAVWMVGRVVAAIAESFTGGR